MRMLRTADNEYINLDTAVSVKDKGTIATVHFANGEVKSFWGEQKDAVLEILTKNSTDLRELVDIRRRQVTPLEIAPGVYV